MKKYIIWGAGDIGKRVYKILGNVNVAAFIDSAEEKWGKEFCGKEIINLEKYKKLYSNYNIIISCAKEQEVANVLDANGINKYYRLQDCPGEFQQPSFGRKLEVFVKNYISPEQTYIICGSTIYSSMVSDWIYEIQKVHPKNITCLEEIQHEKTDSKMEILLTERVDHISGAIKKLNLSIVDLYDCSDKITEYHNETIKKFQDAYKGKRCFIIGTGPSLTMDDLDVLHGHQEKCFSVNDIIKAFDKTQWRPDFLVAEDYDQLSDKTINWNELDVPYTFIGDTNEEFWSKKYKDSIYRYHLVYERCVNKLPKFSEDFSKKSYMGCTVVYSCIQLAAYMGFQEIILLGVDFSYADEQNAVYKHFYSEETPKAIGYTKEVTNAFSSAKKYADKKGIKILNGTRGGKLELFERVNFDNLFA